MLRETALCLLAHDVKRIFLCSMHSHGLFSPQPARWSVFVTQEGYLHPAAAAHAIMAWHLEDKRFVRFVQLADGVWAILFEGDKGSVAVLTKKPGRPTYKISVPARAEAADLFGNPVADGTMLDEKIVYVRSAKAAVDLGKLLAE